MLDLMSLNEMQREAVLAVDGPVAVIAGAGTGKTRTIVFRTAFLLSRGIKPENILSITFTNKAAREMRDRISSMVGKETCAAMTVSTIHSMCARILRDDIAVLGREPKFSIFDTSDQQGLIRRALVDHGLDPKKHDPYVLLSRISAVKSIFPPVDADDFADQVLYKIFHAYNTLLEKNNALDFDDLLGFTVRVLNNKKVREKYQERYHYIMVDEFQDINDIQYQIVRHLTGDRKNLYVVGDDDQSIYGWRGAVVDNILEFEEDFPGAKVIMLEQNYRSTGNILAASGALIENNEKRRKKKLWTTGDAGELIGLYGMANDMEEASLVIDMIYTEKQLDRYKYGDFAILYRTNAQSRPFEEKLMRMGISYTMIGGTRFFERKEVKDMTSFLRILANPEDDVALLRVINFPTRGIGASSIEKFQAMALEVKSAMFPLIHKAADNADIPIKARDGIKAFMKIMDEARGKLETDGLAETARFLFSELKIEETFAKLYQDKNEFDRRLDNVREWVNAVADYHYTERNPTIEGFLENVALMTEEKEEDIDLKEDSVVLMTMHSAKGLEFKVVYIVGAEEKIIPHDRSIKDGTVDEERRLFYVGMTRAKKKLRITYADERRQFGETTRRLPSRFIGETPANLLTEESPEEMEEMRKEANRVAADVGMEKLRKLMEGA